MRKLSRSMFFCAVLLSAVFVTAGCGTKNSVNNEGNDAAQSVTTDSKTPDSEADSEAEDEDQGEAKQEDSEEADSGKVTVESEDMDTSASGGQSTGTQDTGTQDTGAQNTGTQGTGTQDTGAQDTGTQDTKVQDSSEDTASSGMTETTADESGTEITDETADEPRGDVACDEESTLHVGESVTIEGLNFVYAASGEYNKDGATAKEGYKLIYFKVVCKNISKADEFISAEDFICYSDSNVAAQYYTDYDLSAVLSNGRYVTGELIYSVPVSAADVELRYQYDWASEDKLVFLYEGEKDSEYVPVPLTHTKAGALKTGELFVNEELTISYLSSGEFTSSNPQIQPEEGYKFVYCQFEVLNTSSGDKYMSSLDFEGYADGADCRPCYGRTDDLNAILAAGESATGTICFEVPKNAVAIEFEYVIDSWTSKRVVFSYSN